MLDSNLFLFYTSCLKFLCEFLFFTKTKKNFIIENISKVKLEIYQNVMRCLDIFLLGRLIKSFQLKGLQLSNSLYLVNNNSDYSEEKHFVYESSKGPIFHGTFLNAKSKTMVIDLWKKVAHFKIKCERILQEMRFSEQRYQKKVFLFDDNHKLIYSNKTRNYGFSKFQKLIQVLEENHTSGFLDETLENTELTLESVFSNKMCRQSIYELIIKLKQGQVNNIEIPELGTQIELISSLVAEDSFGYSITIDLQLLLNSKQFFVELQTIICDKFLNKGLGNMGRLPTKRGVVWDNNNLKYVDNSEKSSVYTKDSMKSGERARLNWSDNLSGFNKNSNLMGTKKSIKSRGLKRTSISSNLLNLSMISKNLEAQRSIVMEFVPEFMNQNLIDKLEGKQSLEEVMNVKSPHSPNKVIVPRSIRNLKNLEIGKSMFFKEPFLPDICHFKHDNTNNHQELINLEFNGEKQYSSNVINNRKRFKTFSRKKIEKKLKLDKNAEGNLKDEDKNKDEGYSLKLKSSTEDLK